MASLRTNVVLGIALCGAGGFFAWQRGHARRPGGAAPLATEVAGEIRAEAPAAGDAAPTGGNIAATVGNIVPTVGNMSPTGGNIPPTEGNIVSTGGNIPPTGGNIAPTGGNMPPTASTVASTAGTIAPTGANTPPAGANVAPAAPAAPAGRRAAPAPAGDDDVMACDREDAAPAGTEPRAAAPVPARAAPAFAAAPRGERAKALLAALPQDRVEAHVVAPGEFLSKLAKQGQVTVGLIRRLNGLDGDKIRAGQTLALPRGPFRAEVDRAAFTLTIFLGDSPVQQYGIGVGRDGSTPVGEFTVLSKVESPEWTSPEGDFFPSADPKNPLGTRWIGVTEGYGIHGTTDPTSIGRDVSHGCVRLENGAVEEVYDLLTTGARVTIK
jgi:lipoprotein-anchoring transpeptidase ErfK/SrfK